MELRKKNNSSIEFILISKGNSVFSPILPPEDFIDDTVLSFIKRCPEDLFQLHASLDYYEASLQQNYLCGHDLQVINYNDGNLINLVIQMSKRIKLVFINTEIPTYRHIHSIFLFNKEFLVYFHFYNSDGAEVTGLTGEVLSPDSFIKYIFDNQNHILNFLNTGQHEIAPSINIDYKGYNNFHYFKGTHSNYFLINRIIGNFDFPYPVAIENENDNAIASSTKSQNNMDSWERQNIFIEQIDKIDYFKKVCIEHELIRIKTSIEPLLAPIIIVAPFQNPDVKKLYPNIDLAAFSQVEQTNNYINTFEMKKTNPNDIIASASYMAIRIRYLDSISFLHSSFAKSPIIRLPFKGKSIYRELSFFRVDTFFDFAKPKTRAKIKNVIMRLSKIISKTLLSPDLQKKIMERNGQIVAITDLPIEWTELNGIPLAFTHDVCRLPETSPSGLMSLYSINNSFKFSIPKDIIRKTLVIFGSDEQHFKIWQSAANDLAKELKFSTEACNSLEEVKAAVENFKPQLLIFDCHGSFDINTKSTFLYIGDEKLTGEYIVANRITAPLVFLSACGTAPTYGTFNTIANAFFEVGSLAVTTTYLPIAIDSSSVLYIRLLNNLSNAATKLIHKNWLEFVCHTMRTSSIHDAFRKARNKFNSGEDFTSINVKFVTDVMLFANRRKVYIEIDEHLNKLVNKKFNYFASVVPEYLFYSNLGRGDLINFEMWEEAYLSDKS